ncbi:uncharacterized protein LOC121855535 isoform X2 [Homarus americanus]|uniref:uncharacterized protein LOC121855535 isoform X2 n=1 Tax=Homarus americanus TaxID=6706 RepID=UPI001C450BD9|nr:uncharacterized protein LOC121855535 isoform X2 [Homarus americanus]
MWAIRQTTVALICLLSSLATVMSTDLAAVYKKDILLIRDVDKITPKWPLEWESLSLSLPKNLYYPLGLAHDPHTNRLFVADALHRDTKIFSLSFESNYKVEAMHSVVKASGITVMEGLSYDPTSQQLYWTNSSNGGIYKTLIPTELVDDVALEPKLVHRSTNVMDPRGIAIDYCDEQMYWSERGGSKKVPSSVNKLDLKENVHKVIQQDNEMNIYYQGLTYDIRRRKLVWAETVGDKFDDKSQCHFVSLANGVKEPQELFNFENCFPYSVAIGDEYIYWADWSQQGIMRASLIDPKDVVKLVHTPAVGVESNKRHGVYGLALLNDLTEESTTDLCTDTSKINYEKQIDKLRFQGPGTEKLSPEPLDVESPVERTNDDGGHSTDSVDVESPVERTNDDGHSSDSVDVESPVERTNDDGGYSTDSVDVESPVERTNDDGGYSTDSVDVESPAERTNDDGGYSTDSTVTSMSSAENNVEIVIDHHVIKNEPKLGEVEPETEVPLRAPTSIHTNKLKVNAEICNKEKLLWIIAVLSVVCVSFMASTFFLLVKMSCQQSRREAPAPTQVTRQVKRFGPKKRYGSGNKSGINGTSPCSGLSSSDGVSINIEDCCQMTMCETPCYTSMKREGKGYKISENHLIRCEDKKGLLDDCGDI